MERWISVSIHFNRKKKLILYRERKKLEIFFRIEQHPIWKIMIKYHHKTKIMCMLQLEMFLFSSIFLSRNTPYIASLIRCIKCIFFKIADCSSCYAGYYCPKEGTVEPVPCGVGSYSAIGSSNCSTCLPGYYCMSNTTSFVKMKTKFICPAGMHCPPGMSYQPFPALNPCKKGYYCVRGDEVRKSK